MTDETATSVRAGRAPGLSRALTFLMAVAAGLAVANIYYNQPMLGLIEDAFPGSAAGLIPTATQLGYAAGLFLLLPLGDLVDRRRQIVVQFVVLAGALVLAAAAPNSIVLILASLFVGATATVAQQIVPFAASLAEPKSRGATIGTVMSGVLAGILLSRTLGGFVATHAGWREMFWLAVPLALLCAAAMALSLPRVPPQTKLLYGAAVRSLGTLWRTEPALRRAALMQAALFGSFSAFWTILALQLEQPEFGLGAEVAGLFGILGAVGVFAAPISGKLADLKGPRLAITVGGVLTLLSWIAFFGFVSIPGLVVGVIVLDFGVQSALVSNQHVIYALQPEARSRLNTVFMTAMFLGGAAGSAGATLAWDTGGWNAVCAFGAALAAAGCLIELCGRKGDARTYGDVARPS